MLITALATLLQLSLFVSQASWGQGQCSSLFNINKYDTPLVRMVTMEHLPHGGRLLSFRVVSHPDYTNKDRRRDPHGNIVSSSIILGNKAGEFWGFKSQVDRGETLFTQGDVAFLNVKIDVFNSRVGNNDKIPFKFVEKNDKVTNDMEFVVSHGKGEVIIGESGWIRMHDMNYHVLSNLLIPNNFHQVAQAKSRIIADFHRYLVEKELMTGDVAKTMENVVQERARDIDLTGNVHIAFLLSKGDRQLLSTSGLKSELSNYLRGGLSAVEYMRNMIFTHAVSRYVQHEMQSHFSKFLESRPLLPEHSERPQLPLLEPKLIELTFDQYLKILEHSYQ